MSALDICILALILVSSFVGLIRGLVKELFSVVIWTAAGLVTALFNEPLSHHLPIAAETSEELGRAAAGVLLFVGTVLLGSLVTKLVSGLVKVSGLSGTDRALGGAFGLIRGAIIVLALLIFVPALAPIDDKPWWQESRLVPEFLAMEAWARGLLAELIAWFHSFFG